mmetsp:Transcript_16545/g.30963  ORF Transcript_16545/g.30963 Transcript_16545/m.30963 type:complete len:106 (-) Transcript_16545:1819-2136(-)
MHCSKMLASKGWISVTDKSNTFSVRIDTALTEAIGSSNKLNTKGIIRISFTESWHSRPRRAISINDTILLCGWRIYRMLEQIIWMTRNMPSPDIIFFLGLCFDNS